MIERERMGPSASAQNAGESQSWRKKLLDRVKTAYAYGAPWRRSVTPTTEQHKSSVASASTVVSIIPEVAEEDMVDREEGDDGDEDSLYSQTPKDFLTATARSDGSDGGTLNQSKSSAVLSDAFSVVFNPRHDLVRQDIQIMQVSKTTPSTFPPTARLLHGLPLPPPKPPPRPLRRLRLPVGPPRLPPHHHPLPLPPPAGGAGGRPARRPLLLHLRRRARHPGGHRHRRHALRLHPPVHHAPLLGVQEHLPEVRLQVVRRLPAGPRVQPQEGRLCVDQQGAKVL